MSVEEKLHGFITDGIFQEGEVDTYRLFFAGKGKKWLESVLQGLVMEECEKDALALAFKEGKIEFVRSILNTVDVIDKKLKSEGTKTICQTYLK